MPYKIVLFIIAMMLSLHSAATDNQKKSDHWHGKKFVYQLTPAEKIQLKKMGVSRDKMPVFTFAKDGTFKMMGALSAWGTYEIKGKKLNLTLAKVRKLNVIVKADDMFSFTIVGDFKQLELRKGNRIARYVME